MHPLLVLACGPSGWPAVVILLLGGAVSIALPVLGLIAVVKLVSMAWLRFRPAAEPATPLPAALPELEGADEDLRQAHGVYVALRNAVELHRFEAAPERELDRADELVRGAQAPIARAAPRLPPERAEVLRQLRTAVVAERDALVTCIERSAKRLGVAPAVLRTQLAALPLLEGGVLFCGARQRAWAVGAMLAAFVMQKSSGLPLPAFVTQEGLGVLAPWLGAGAVFVVAGWLRAGLGRVVLTGLSLLALASVLLAAGDTLWWPSLLPVAGAFLWWARSRLAGPRTA